MEAAATESKASRTSSGLGCGRPGSAMALAPSRRWRWRWRLRGARGDGPCLRQSGRTDSRRCGDHPDGNAIRGRRSGGPLWVHRGPRQGGPRPPGAPPGAPQWRRNSRGDVVCDEFQSVPVCPLWVPQGVPAFSTNTLMMENHMIEYRDLRDARSKCSRVAALTT